MSSAGRSQGLARDIVSVLTFMHSTTRPAVKHPPSLVALLPDLWTVWHRPSDKAVSQHATEQLALKHASGLALELGLPVGLWRVEQPLHSAQVKRQARAAIHRAQMAAAGLDMHVTCDHCNMWHHVDEDCPPPPRRTGGFDHTQEP